MDVLSLLGQTASIAIPTQTTTASGTTKQVFRTVRAGVLCSVAPMTGREAERFGAWSSQATSVVIFDYEVSVDATYRLTINGREYNVLHVDTRYDLSNQPHHKACAVEEVR